MSKLRIPCATRSPRKSNDWIDISIRHSTYISCSPLKSYATKPKQHYTSAGAICTPTMFRKICTPQSMASSTSSTDRARNTRKNNKATDPRWFPRKSSDSIGGDYSPGFLSGKRTNTLAYSYNRTKIPALVFRPTAYQPPNNDNFSTFVAPENLYRY